MSVPSYPMTSILSSGVSRSRPVIPLLSVKRISQYLLQYTVHSELSTFLLTDGPPVLRCRTRVLHSVTHYGSLRKRTS